MEKQTDKQQNCIFKDEHKDMTGNFCTECGTILNSGLELKERFRQETYKEILKFIETERDNGNLEGVKGFSASLCLSKLMKKLEK
jgi:hypothetical protein